ncbi:AraC family transcriptional regulator [Caballeronia hypogeia]|uniref:AraC family transcriptional regulator n=1 Tax=Caballeronia hypogeia TaxID=1777140 RepID=A0A157ZKK0_9BURK|nr:helix-turn-helix domain-containing protein [Caballeronia hypogeia]SAK46058.1 AraC family transcriptional regulator [Caballeronia hypogeia]
MKRSPGMRTYAMAERASHLDFDIRDQSVRQQLTQPHRHEYFQVLVTLRGEATHLIGGSVRKVRAGTVTFVLPYRSHVCVMPPGAEYVVISFSLRFLRPDSTLDPLGLEYANANASALPEIAPFLAQEVVDFMVGESDMPWLHATLDAMLRENRERRAFSAMMLRAFLLELIGGVCRRNDRVLAEALDARRALSNRQDWLVRVTRLMQERLGGDLALKDAADAANLSPGHLAHALKRETGRTFTELLTERRMERARELLMSSSLRLTEIAHATGFTDESYFARRFRQHFGVSPGAFRRQGEQETTGKAQFCPIDSQQPSIS